MAFKKGQSVIVAIFKGIELIESKTAIVEKGGKEFFYIGWSKFSQITSRLDWERTYGQYTKAFESDEALNHYIERTALVAKIKIFFDSSYKSQIENLSNKQLKEILDIISR